MTTTRIDEIAEGIYRIATPIDVPGGFSFNQYLIDDEYPLLYHTGPRRLFRAVASAVERVLPLDRLRYVGLSHVEADECGSLNEFLMVAPDAIPVCGTIAAMTSIADMADRPPLALDDGASLDLGGRTLHWLATPHLPHGWECGHLHDPSTGTLFCGDLFTQGGAHHAPLTAGDILGPSEAFRRPLDYFAHAPDTGAMLERLASLDPTTLACMHGSAWTGDGAGLLRELGRHLDEGR